jgi:hypothetical protein
LLGRSDVVGVHYLIGHVRSVSELTGQSASGAHHPRHNRKETIMSTKFAIPLATVGLLLAAVEPGLAATRGHRAADAYASSAVTHKRTTPYSSDREFGGSWNGAHFPAAGTAAEPLGRGHNLPYPDRPYGDPDSW